MTVKASLTEQLMNMKLHFHAPSKRRPLMCVTVAVPSDHPLGATGANIYALKPSLSF